jgi:hypothetical protein
MLGRRKVRSRGPVIRRPRLVPTPEGLPAATARKALPDRMGLYEVRREGINTTTRQAEALNLAVAGPPLGMRGTVIGTDLHTGQVVIHDVFDDYAMENIESGAVLLVGDVGNGKSSVLKTVYGIRQLRRANRQVAIITKKREGHGGEYDRLCQITGITPIRFGRGGGMTINPLDPRIVRDEQTAYAPGGGDLDEGDLVGQDSLVRAVLEIIMHRSLAPREGYALRAAHAQVVAQARDTGVEPTLRDLAFAMLHPDETAAAYVSKTTAELLEWGMDAALELDRMCQGDLAGIVDGPTNADVDLDADLVVFDVSALPDDGDAIAIVMAVLSTWLTNVWLRVDGKQRTFIVEEGWHLISRASSARILRRLYRLHRAYALQVVAAIHHLSDLPQRGADNEEAYALVQDAAVVYVLKQKQPRDAEDCVRVLGLPSSCADHIRKLRKGCFLLKIGDRDPIAVRHERSNLEVWLTDTDAAMLGRPMFEIPVPMSVLDEEAEAFEVNPVISRVPASANAADDAEPELLAKPPQVVNGRSTAVGQSPGTQGGHVINGEARVNGDHEYGRHAYPPPSVPTRDRG